jgi:hypothetical protein
MHYTKNNPNKDNTNPSQPLTDLQLIEKYRNGYKITTADVLALTKYTSGKFKIVSIKKKVSSINDVLFKLFRLSSQCRREYLQFKFFKF